jgi:hypothetical protein
VVIMNFRLYDGTVRCADHMDASSYQGTTSDPCAYCPTESTTCPDCWALPGECACIPSPPKVNRYRVLFGHPGEPTAGILFSVDAPTPGHAQDLCNDAVRDEGGLLDGCVFTIWPVPVDN